MGLDVERLKLTEEEVCRALDAGVSTFPIPSQLWDQLSEKDAISVADAQLAKAIYGLVFHPGTVLPYKTADFLKEILIGLKAAGISRPGVGNAGY